MAPFPQPCLDSAPSPSPPPRLEFCHSPPTYSWDLSGARVSPDCTLRLSGPLPRDAWHTPPPPLKVTPNPATLCVQKSPGLAHRTAWACLRLPAVSAVWDRHVIRCPSCCTVPGT
ncbi:hypothetical protein KIL84_021731 [Mauremys mutica]|uniref:Uncharacterized protein n=1 Tax=Mauremys mutica TaxID=74926 RepID=A0A9D3XFW7_9SAUR|nr:hypothetical protein KIL84_021731 [Mauremys mutica]